MWVTNWPIPYCLIRPMCIRAFALSVCRLFQALRAPRRTLPPPLFLSFAFACRSQAWTGPHLRAVNGRASPHPPRLYQLLVILFVRVEHAVQGESRLTPCQAQQLCCKEAVLFRSFGDSRVSAYTSDVRGTLILTESGDLDVATVFRQMPSGYIRNPTYR